jgi:hypothetical protein
MNAIPKRHDTAHSTDHPFDAVATELAWSEARRRSLQRTLQALFREHILNRDQLITEGAVSWLPLWSQQGMLRFDGLAIGRIGDCRLLSRDAADDAQGRVLGAGNAAAKAGALLGAGAGGLALAWVPLPAMFWTVVLLYAVAAIGMRAIRARATVFQPIQTPTGLS